MRFSYRQAAPPAPDHRRWWDASLVAAAVGSGTVLLSYLLGVVVPLGRGVDDRAMRWAERAGAGTQPWVHALLAYVSPVLVAIGVVLVVLREVRRGDRTSAVRVVALVVGSELLAQAVKVSLPRPGGGTNTLPSGHVTMIAALMVATAAVGGWRGVMTMFGILVVAAAALGTMVIGWHRPSDIVAACGVVAVCWTAVGLIGRARRPDSHRGTRSPVPAPASSVADGPTLPATRPVLVARPRPAGPRPGEPMAGPLRNPRPRRPTGSVVPVDPATLPASRPQSGRGVRAQDAVRAGRPRDGLNVGRRSHRGPLADPGMGGPASRQRWR